MSETNKSSDIVLVDLIDALRTQLGELNQRASVSDNGATAFEVQDIELEVLVKASQETEGSTQGKIKFLVADLGGSAKLKDVQETTQKVKLTLKPKVVGRSSHESYDINGEVNRIRGD